jgi:hypothetical protein
VVTKVYAPPGLAGPGASWATVATTPLAPTGGPEGIAVLATALDDTTAEMPRPAPANAHNPTTAVAIRLFISITLLTLPKQAPEVGPLADLI